MSICPPSSYILLYFNKKLRCFLDLSSDLETLPGYLYPQEAQDNLTNGIHSHGIYLQNWNFFRSDTESEHTKKPMGFHGATMFAVSACVIPSVATYLLSCQKLVITRFLWDQVGRGNQKCWRSQRSIFSMSLRIIGPSKLVILRTLPLLYRFKPFHCIGGSKILRGLH